MGLSILFSFLLMIIFEGDHHYILATSRHSLCPPYPSETPDCCPPQHQEDVDVDNSSDQEDCVPATADLSPLRHVYAVENLGVDKVSFGSCHMPEGMERVPNFWEDMRTVSHPDIWLWLGDNMYKDGSNINEKRLQYNKVKEEPRYKEHGPINSESPIPIMAGWDDHDYGYNDGGSEYLCKEQSQVLSKYYIIFYMY